MTRATAAVPPRAPTRTMTLPGKGRVVMRRAAKDPSSGLSAYLVKEGGAGASCNVSVAIKRKGRYIGTVLRGHRNTIVDMEFLPTPADSPIFTLGTCDQDGVVFLWFLRLAKDALGIDYALKQLRKYSFYSLRKNKAAYYNRIRLAGTPEKGTMVLVPNDGSNVRVICFSCEPSQDPAPMPALAAPAPVPQIEAPQEEQELVRQIEIPEPAVENKAREGQMHTPTPIAQYDFTQSRGVKAGAAVGATAAALGAGALAAAGQMDEEADDEIDEDYVDEESESEFDDTGALDDNSGAPSPIRDALNSTFPLSRRAENEGPEVDDDIAEAAARGAGIAAAVQVKQIVTDAEYLAEGVVEPVDGGVDGEGNEGEDVYEAEGDYEEYADDDDYEYEDAEDGEHEVEMYANVVPGTTTRQEGSR